MTLPSWGRSVRKTQQPKHAKVNETSENEYRGEKDAQNVSAPQQKVLWLLGVRKTGTAFSCTGTERSVHENLQPIFLGVETEKA